MNHSLNSFLSLFVYCFIFSEQMSTTSSSLLLLDDERKAQLDLLNKIDESSKNLAIDQNVLVFQFYFSCC